MEVDKTKYSVDGKGTDSFGTALSWFVSSKQFGLGAVILTMLAQAFHTWKVLYSLEQPMSMPAKVVAALFCTIATPAIEGTILYFTYKPIGDKKIAGLSWPVFSGAALLIVLNWYYYYSLHGVSEKLMPGIVVGFIIPALTAAFSHTIKK